MHVPMNPTVLQKSNPPGTQGLEGNVSPWGEEGRVQVKPGKDNHFGDIS